MRITIHNRFKINNKNSKCALFHIQFLMMPFGTTKFTIHCLKAAFFTNNRFLNVLLYALFMMLLSLCYLLLYFYAINVFVSVIHGCTNVSQIFTVRNHFIWSKSLHGQSLTGNEGTQVFLLFLQCVKWLKYNSSHLSIMALNFTVVVSKQIINLQRIRSAYFSFLRSRYKHEQRVCRHHVF